VTRSPLLVALLLLAACGTVPPIPGVGPTLTVPVPTVRPVTTSTPAPDPMLEVIPYTGRVTAVHGWPTACVARQPRVAPDPGCTPGSVTSTDEKTVCSPAYAARPRPYTAAAKTRLMKAYGVPPADRDITELDHLIERSLGGSDDVSNLWPQVSDLPNAGWHNSKDTVEQKVWHAVCVEHRKTLAQAQAAMRSWTGAVAVLGL